MRRWLPLIILAAAQFVMVLDSSVMNVSISQIVADLDTTVTGVQTAITAYTLVMAAFMLVGAKLGDIWGRDRAFAIGLAVYGLGSLTTALSPNLDVLLVRLVARRRARRGARDPGHRRPGRGQLRGEGSRLRLRDHRRRRRGGDRGRPGDRRLGDDVLLLALRVRRRGRDRHRHPRSCASGCSRRRGPTTRRGSTSSVRRSRPRALA